MEFVLVKLSISDSPREIRLEVGLEYLGNPLVGSAEEARKILSEDIFLESSAGRFCLADKIDQVLWEEVEELEEWAPLIGSDDEGEEHRVLVGRLDLSNLNSESLTLHVSEESLQAAIYWVDEKSPTTRSVRRVILVAGDHSLPVELPAPPNNAWNLIVGGIVALGILIALAVWVTVTPTPFASLAGKIEHSTGIRGLPRGCKESQKVGSPNSGKKTESSCSSSDSS